MGKEMTDKETNIQKIQALLEKAGDRELELLYSFALSLTRE